MSQRIKRMAKMVQSIGSPDRANPARGEKLHS